MYEYSVRTWSLVIPTSGVIALPEPVVVWQAPVMPTVDPVAADFVETSVTASPSATFTPGLMPVSELPLLPVYVNV